MPIQWQKPTRTNPGPGTGFYSQVRLGSYVTQYVTMEEQPCPIDPGLWLHFHHKSIEYDRVMG